MKSRDDVFLWPDGSWAYRGEMSEFSHKSDDYIIIYIDTPEWYAFMGEDLDV